MSSPLNVISNLVSIGINHIEQEKNNRPMSVTEGNIIDYHHFMSEQSNRQFLDEDVKKYNPTEAVQFLLFNPPSRWLTKQDDPSKIGLSTLEAPILEQKLGELILRPEYNDVTNQNPLNQQEKVLNKKIREYLDQYTRPKPFYEIVRWLSQNKPVITRDEFYEIVANRAQQKEGRIFDELADSTFSKDLLERGFMYKPVPSRLWNNDSAYRCPLCGRLLIPERYRTLYYRCTSGCERLRASHVWTINDDTFDLVYKWERQERSMASYIQPLCEPRTTDQYRIDRTEGDYFWINKPLGCYWTGYGQSERLLHRWIDDFDEITLVERWPGFGGDPYETADFQLKLPSGDELIIDVKTTRLTRQDVPGYYGDNNVKEATDWIIVVGVDKSTENLLRNHDPDNLFDDSQEMASAGWFKNQLSTV